MQDEKKFCDEFIIHLNTLSSNEKIDFISRYEEYEVNVKNQMMKDNNHIPLNSELISYSYLIKISEDYLIEKTFKNNLYPINTSHPKWVREIIMERSGYDPSINSLKNYRLSLGYSQKKLAKKLNVIETSYLNWERKKVIPRFEELVKLKDFFNIPSKDMWKFITTFKNKNDEN